MIAHTLCYVFPHQLPGPEQSDASDGDEPQHAVSPGPGKPVLTGPDSDEGAEINFLMFELLQNLHFKSVSEPVTRSSLVFPQFSQI